MWDFLWYFLAVLYVPACIGLIVIVLLQKGKGTGFAGAFGVGPGSETVFGPQTAQGMPVKITYVMAGMFMAIALLMSIISGRVGAGVAPALVDESSISDVPSSTGLGLEEYGLGTGVTGQIDSNAITVETPAGDAASAPVVSVPAVTEPAPTAEVAPADVAPEAVPAEAAPAATPAEVAPAAVDTAPVESAPVEAAPEAAAPAAPVEETAPATE